MDTDSAYMAFSAPTMEDVIRPAMRRDFFLEYSEWFPRQACAKHNAAFVETRVAGEAWKRPPCCEEAFVHDRRKPGLFKVRFSDHRERRYNSIKKKDSTYAFIFLLTAGMGRRGVSGAE